MEMVVVIAIIVFLSAVTLTSIAQYTKRARDLSTNVRAHNAAMASEEEIVDNYLTTTRSTEGNATTNNSHQAIVPTESETESTTEATTTQKQNPPPQQPTTPPTQPTTPPTQPTTPPTQPTESTTQPTQPTQPAAPGGNGNTTTNTGFNNVTSLTAPAGYKVNNSNDYGHGGNVQLKVDKDMQQFKTVKVVIKVEGNGKFSNAWGTGNNGQVSGDGKTLTFTIQNNSNPYWADPTFGPNATYDLNWNFANNQNGNLNITVTAQK